MWYDIALRILLMMKNDIKEKNKQTRPVKLSDCLRYKSKKKIEQTTVHTQLCVFTVYITIVSQTTESFTNPPTSLF